jgi:hypothetical protein
MDAIQRVTADKAPRPDQIPNRVLKVIIEWIAPQLVTIFSASLRLGYYLEDWKRSITIALRKPRKDNYLKLKLYRPIALLNTIRKLLELIITRRLS